MAKSRPRKKLKQDEAARQYRLAARRAHYKKNREQILEKLRQRRLINPEAAKERDRKNRAKYREKRNARNREYMREARVADPEKFRRRAKENAAKNREAARVRSARYYARHKDKALASNNKSAKKRRQSKPCFAIASRLRCRLRKAIATQSAGKSQKTLELLGCSIQQLLSHIESLFLPGMSWSNRSLWHIDHIIPLASFDLTDPEQQAAACHYTNLRPLWAKENQKKGAKPPMPQQLFGFAYAAKIKSGLMPKRSRRRRSDEGLHGDH
jgi:hypothetical protein